VPPPPPIEVEGEIEFEVEAILDSRVRHRRLQYLVSWLGHNERTWEPSSNVANCPDLIAEFHARYPAKPGPQSSRPGGRS
jgi:hypothetical protein